jgi:hypothetical protein
MRRIRSACCARDNRHHCPTAQKRDELAPPHSITSSARTSSEGGTSRPSALAVFRLRTVSYLVGAWTGRSAGLAPRQVRRLHQHRRAWL